MIIEYTCPKCGGDLQHFVICTYPPINQSRCPNCGWTYEEREKIEKIPFPIENNGIYINLNKETFHYCDNCSNHPLNGGSGICHCILGTPTITC